MLLNRKEELTRTEHASLKNLERPETNEHTFDGSTELMSPIKGVDTKKRGKIYHATTYPDYKQVKPTICFKDVASAEKAGYKLPQAK